MKKYFVIGNPISHSFSPVLHNFWFKENNINAIYEREKLNSEDLKNFILKIKDGQIDGANITVPFKMEIINYLDELRPEAEKTQSVNTVSFENNKAVGHNTDISGFIRAIKDIKLQIEGKKILILGAGGVVPSIIYALNEMKASEIIVSNRTKQNAINLKNFFNYLTIVDWGKVPEFDIIINATSLGLKNSDVIDIDFSQTEKGKVFYDLIYNPSETNFLKKARLLGNKTENGKRMFIHQAAQAFKIWNKIEPKINNEVNKLLDQ